MVSLERVRYLLWIEGNRYGFSEEDHLVLQDAVWQLGLALELLQLQEKLTKAATTDALTGLNNRSEFLRTLDHQLKLAKRHGPAQKVDFCIIFLDLDHFKFYNDTFGHNVGDLALRLFSRTLSTVLRTTDSICRYGGDEFVILLPSTDLEGAQITADRIIDAMSKANGFEAEVGDFLGESVSIPDSMKLTCSLGVCGYEWDSDCPVDQFINRADVAAYNAKKGGRNRYCLG